MIKQRALNHKGLDLSDILNVSDRTADVYQYIIVVDKIISEQIKTYPSPLPQFSLLSQYYYSALIKEKIILKLPLTYYEEGKLV